VVDELLGDPSLDDDQISVIRGTLRECGAVDEVEQIIQSEVRRAIDAITAAPVSRSARDRLVELATTVTRRES
jgi:geranylgeranyl diphosphate synthase type I